MKWNDLTDAEKKNVATELATQILADIHTPHEPHKATTSTPDGYAVIFESDQLKTSMLVSKESAEDFVDGAKDFPAFKAIGFGRKHIEAIKATLRRGPR
jgi:streptomycin 6-kinase